MTDEIVPQTTPPDKLLEELTQDQLDEMVHEAKDLEATHICNRGRDWQIRWLMGWGITAAEETQVWAIVICTVLYLIGVIT